MYEDMTFENIMDRCLDRVSSSIDKREGSVVYDAIAPAAAELAIMYIELAYLMDRAFPDTESGDDLTKKVRERSIFRTPATAAIRKGYFEDGNGAAMDVPIGTRFSGDNLNYTVTEKIATGQFRLLCETPGAAGNQYQGNLFPIDYVEGLGAARLADILINGEDEESDEDLLDRYMDSLQAQAYGGNKADYKTKVELLQGVGAVKVFPVWNGGGTVKIVFVNSDWGIPSSDLVNSVQTAVDPVQNQGVGDGIAPIGHVVTVEGVTEADWTPDATASLWKKIGDPTEEWPAWSQPIGAHDAYNSGDKVSHNGKHWTSNIDANVWEPGVYGWTEVTE